MPRGKAPQWRQRKEPILDQHLFASVTQAGSVHDENGHYAQLVYAGCESRERAEEIKRALYRSGYHLKLSVAAKIVKRGDCWDVEFKAIDKTFAKKYVMDTYGDRSKLPYDPWKKGGGK